MTEFFVLTLFPEMIEAGFQFSILGRARQQGYIAAKAVDIRDFAHNKHNRVDDAPYGGGAGMVMQAQPIYDAYQSLPEESRKRARVIYMTPQGRPFTQRVAEELARERTLVLLCGHYEGVDERVLEEIVTDSVSLGDFVLTGGELAALAVADAVPDCFRACWARKSPAGRQLYHGIVGVSPVYPAGNGSGPAGAGGAFERASCPYRPMAAAGVPAPDLCWRPDLLRAPSFPKRQKLSAQPVEEAPKPKE